MGEHEYHVPCISHIMVITMNDKLELPASSHIVLILQGHSQLYDRSKVMPVN